MARPPKIQAPAIGDMKKWIWVLLCLGLFLLIAPAIVILVAGGMVPTLVAWVCDRTEEKYATFCVGGMNFTGIFPYILELWTKNNTVSAALDLFADVFSLAVMYGAAGFGWAIFLSVPPVVAAFINVMAQARLKTLKASQEIIIEEWGPETENDAQKVILKTPV